MKPLYRLNLVWPPCALQVHLPGEHVERELSVPVGVRGIGEDNIAAPDDTPATGKGLARFRPLGYTLDYRQVAYVVNGLSAVLDEILPPDRSGDRTLGGRLFPLS